MGQVPQVLFLDGVCVAVARSSRKPNMEVRGARGGGGGRTGVTGGAAGTRAGAGGEWAGLGPGCTHKTYLCPPTDGTLWSLCSGRSDHQKRLGRPPTGAGSVAVGLRRLLIARLGLKGPVKRLGGVSVSETLKNQQNRPKSTELTGAECGGPRRAERRDRPHPAHRWLGCRGSGCWGVLGGVGGGCTRKSHPFSDPRRRARLDE